MVDGDFGSLLDVVRYEYVYEVGGGGRSSIRWVGGLSFAGSVLLGFLLFFRGGVTSSSPQSGRICLGS